MDIAKQLGDACPVELGQEIVLTGSTARGTADRNSDVELNFWVNQMPDRDIRRQWLNSMGCTDIVLDREYAGDGSEWTHFCFQGVLIEIEWQALHAASEDVTALVHDEVIDHRRLVKAWVIESAIPIKAPAEGMARWKTPLAEYPRGVQVALISDAVREWRFSHIMNSRWSLVQRQERFAVTQQVSADLQKGRPNPLRRKSTVGTGLEMVLDWMKITH